MFYWHGSTNRESSHPASRIPGLYTPTLSSIGSNATERGPKDVTYFGKNNLYILLLALQSKSGLEDLEASGWSSLNMHGVCGPWTLFGWMLPLVHDYNRVWLQKRLGYVLLLCCSKIVSVVFFKLVYNHGCMKLLPCMPMLWVPQWNDHRGGAKLFVKRRKPRKRPYHLSVFTVQHTSR